MAAETCAGISHQRLVALVLRRRGCQRLSPFANGCEYRARRFMIFTALVPPEKRRVIPSVTHVDDSARPQTVEREVNSLYCRLIDEFDAVSGVPVIMNTSFNLRGEAIVHTPSDA